MQKNYVPAPGASFPLLKRFIATSVRCLYFNAVNLVDEKGRPLQPLQDEPPTVFYISHRNGAVDGYVVQKLMTNAMSMVSVQLTVHPYLKYFFSGIPVLRAKDKERFAGLEKELGNPILHSIAHVQAGGSLCIYPEGSSQWGYTHLPYQEGGAKIIRHLIQKGQAFHVRTVGLFYDAPDQFRSNVDVVVSEPIEITPQREQESTKMWERRIFEQINKKLEAMSVHCRDMAHFEAVSAWAKYLRETKGYYGTHFIATQNQPNYPVLPEPTPVKKSWVDIFSLICTLYFMLLISPVLLLGWLAGKKADAKNTVSFFKILATAPVLIIWLGIIITLSFFHPLLMASLVLAVLGFKAYPNIKQRFFKK